MNFTKHFFIDSDGTLVVDVKEDFIKVHFKSLKQ
jgi:hypothetical protein